MPDNASAAHHEVELRRVVEENARRETWCVRALVLVLILEAVVFWRYAGDKPWYETLAFILADLGVALTVGGEVIFEARRSSVQSSLNRISEEKVAASLARAAEADARAAEAKLKAEEARLELAKYREPRVLDSSRIDQVVERLRPFSKSRYDFSVGQIPPEYVVLVSSVEVALEKAGWVGVDNESTPTGLRRDPKPRIGIGARFDEVKIGVPTEALAAAGEALAEALTAEGIEAEVIPPPQEALPPQLTTCIHILIGPKK